MRQDSKLLHQVRDRTRVKHYSISTQAQYGRWVRRFIRLHGKRLSRDMGAGEVEAFLSHRTVDGKTTAIVVSIALSRLAWLARRWSHRLCPARHGPWRQPSRFA